LTHLPFSPLLYKYHGLEGFLHCGQEVHREQIPSYHSKLRLLLELRKNMSIQVLGAPSQNAKLELKDEVRNELFATSHLSQQLGLIDALQCLDVAYHFEREIQEALEHIYMTFNDKIDFPLVFDYYAKKNLRFHVMFSKNSKTKMESLTNNIDGMLAFYEATHLKMHGEDILDETLEFTTTYLKSIASLIGNLLAAQITCSLKQPLHKGIPQLKAWRYISFYEQDASHNKSLHKEELSYITRIVECYFWIVSVYFEPQYSLARKILTKVISMTSILDDIYDAYGTLEELEPFIEAIESCIDQLPKYMQICCRALFDVFEAIENELAKK
ncbi:(-)-germacrene d synthase, partial [Quercus suber]